GDTERAIKAYEQVLAAGVNEPSVHFNLGSLYWERLRLDDAAGQFELAVLDADFTLGSHFALGECRRADGQLDQALRHFLEVLKILDLSTVEPDRADELTQLYEGFADSDLASSDRDAALEFAGALVEFLSSDDWPEKVLQSRESLNVLSADGPLLSLTEMFSVAESERIFRIIGRAAEYSLEGLYYTAIEECYHAMRYAPTYLPIHLQLAKVLNEMGDVEGATTKLIAIADSYKAKRLFHQAIAVYGQALSLAPMGTVVRAKLIELYTSQGRIDLALEHYLVLAENYFHRAQMDQARDVYQEALRLAPRGNPDRKWEVEILHRIADIDMQRIDWKRAATVYERIRRLAPDDERARLALMELYDRFNRTDMAVSEIDALIKIYRARGDDDKVFTLLEEAVLEREDSIPLRTRLAQAYLDVGVVDKALEHLDKLGDLQLDAGRIDDAKATLQAVIALGPDNVADYQVLLKQLG
ncbi:MAG: tetratricopeptide repeat protein, partial [Anaerolineae bacterium]|nr:tetratricopeptide repeat protein [Anaerolineae bacterium]